MYCYWVVYLNDISENIKLRLLKQKIKMMHTMLTEKFFFKKEYYLKTP
jgi:hypothetical protein